MEVKLLTDPLVAPDDKVLEAALGKNFKLFTEFRNIISVNNLVLEWHYYNDGKQWLCKTLNKKKNLCWLSVWNTGFKLTFYFLERAIGGVYSLDISDEIKAISKETKTAGKSHPVMFIVKNKKLMNDSLKILAYKKDLK